MDDVKLSNHLNHRSITSGAIAGFYPEVLPRKERRRAAQRIAQLGALPFWIALAIIRKTSTMCYNSVNGIIENLKRCLESPISPPPEYMTWFQVSTFNGYNLDDFSKKGCLD